MRLRDYVMAGAAAALTYWWARGRRGTDDQAAAAAPLVTRSSAGADLDTIFAELAVLHEIAGDPRQSQDGDRVYDFSIRWGAVLSGRLRRLQYLCDRDELTPDELGRFQRLVAELDDTRPLADRLRLARAQSAVHGRRR